MNNQTKIYTVTPAQIASFRAELAAAKIAVPAGNLGLITIPQYEVVLNFAYDGSSKLTLTIMHDAWYETAGQIWNKVDSYLPKPTIV